MALRIAVVVGLLVGIAAPAAQAAPLRPCSERVEGGAPIAFRSPGDVVVGRIAFFGAARYADPATFAEEYDERGGFYGIKIPVTVRADRNVKLSIAPAQRAIAGLGYTDSQRTAAPGRSPSVSFHPCRRNKRAFSYDGVVGPATAFSGGIALAEPACLTLETRVRGRAPVRRTLSFGMGDACPAA